MTSPFLRKILAGIIGFLFFDIGGYITHNGIPFLVAGIIFFFMCRSWIDRHPQSAAIYHFPMETLAIEILEQKNFRRSNCIYFCGEHSDLVRSKILLTSMNHNTGITSEAFEMQLPQRYTDDENCRLLAARVASRIRANGDCLVSEVRRADGTALSYIQCQITR